MIRSSLKEEKREIFISNIYNILFADDKNFIDDESRKAQENTIQHEISEQYTAFNFG